MSYCRLMYVLMGCSAFMNMTAMRHEEEKVTSFLNEQPPLKSFFIGRSRLMWKREGEIDLERRKCPVDQYNVDQRLAISNGAEHWLCDLDPWFRTLGDQMSMVEHLLEKEQLVKEKAECAEFLRQITIWGPRTYAMREQLLDFLKKEKMPACPTMKIFQMANISLGLGKLDDAMRDYTFLLNAPEKPWDAAALLGKAAVYLMQKNIKNKQEAAHAAFNLLPAASGLRIFAEWLLNPLSEKWRDSKQY